MSTRKYDLVVVAHPDDETIFFGGLIQRRRKSATSRPIKVVCVTNGNADGQGQLRKKQFKKACAALGVDSTSWLDFEDRYEQRISIAELSSRLKELPHPTEIFTHGIIGEYGHPHHQDVCFAAHQAFVGHPRLYSVAHNAFPELRIQLTAEEFAEKARILTKIYGSETSRFLNLLPATSSEGFLRLQADEVQTVYDFLAHEKPMKGKLLKNYRWLKSYLEQNRKIARPF